MMPDLSVSEWAGVVLAVVAVIVCAASVLLFGDGE